MATGRWDPFRYVGEITEVIAILVREVGERWERCGITKVGCGTLGERGKGAREGRLFVSHEKIKKNFERISAQIYTRGPESETSMGYVIFR